MTIDGMTLAQLSEKRDSLIEQGLRLADEVDAGKNDAIPALRASATEFKQVEEAINKYLEEDWSQLEAPIKEQSFAAFETAFVHCVDMANAYHELKDKPYLRWKLPDTPPPDLDLTPRPSSK